MTLVKFNWGTYLFLNKVASLLLLLLLLIEIGVKKSLTLPLSNPQSWLSSLPLSNPQSWLSSSMFGRSNVVFFLGFVCLYQWMWRVENLLLFLTEQST
jgi:hypothetical protein